MSTDEKRWKAVGGGFTDFFKRMKFLNLKQIFIVKIRTNSGHFSNFWGNYSNNFVSLRCGRGGLIRLETHVSKTHVLKSASMWAENYNTETKRQKLKNRN